MGASAARRVTVGPSSSFAFCSIGLPPNRRGMAMRWSRDGQRIPTTVFEAALHHEPVRATCRRCGRVAIFDPHQLWWLFHRRGWDDRLTAVGQRLRCSGQLPPAANDCRGQASIDLVRSNTDATLTLPWPPEAEWKRAVRRVRT